MRGAHPPGYEPHEAPHIWANIQVTKPKKDKEVSKPFPFADFKRYLPSWFEHSRTDEEESADEPTGAAASLAKALGVQNKKAQQHLSLLQWTAAFDRYALAAAAAGVLNFTNALKHKDNCLKLAEQTRLKGGKVAVGLGYDTLARRRGSEYSYNGVEDFDVNTACLTVDNDLVTEAEATLDRPTKTNNGQSYSHGGHQPHSYSGAKRKLSWNKGYQDDKRRKCRLTTYSENSRGASERWSTTVAATVSGVCTQDTLRKQGSAQGERHSCLPTAPVSGVCTQDTSHQSDLAQGDRRSCMPTAPVSGACTQDTPSHSDLAQGERHACAPLAPVSGACTHGTSLHRDPTTAADLDSSDGECSGAGVDDEGPNEQYLRVLAKTMATPCPGDAARRPLDPDQRAAVEWTATTPPLEARAQREK